MSKTTCYEAVLVLGNVGPSLTVIRSLGRTGYHVVVGWEETTRLVDRSRHADEFWAYPSPDHGERTFVRALSKFLERRPDVAIVFPVGEKTLSCLARHARELPVGPRVAMPEARALLTCLDKSAACEMALKLGIPVPRYRRAHNLEEVHIAAEEIGYPCVVKPLNSFRPFFGRKAILCRSSHALRQQLSAWPAGNDCLIVQEYMRGYRHNCHFAAMDGMMLAYFEHRSLRTVADGMGEEVFGQSVEPSASLRHHTATLAAQLNYSGVGCAQFVADDDNDVCGFMEINPRLDGCCALPYHCGYDFPRLAVECATWLTAPVLDVPATYAAGQSIHWGSGDIQALGAALRRREVGLGGAVQWAGNIARDALRSDVDVTWSWRDPIPMLAGSAGAFSKAAKLVLSSWLGVR